MTFHLQIFDKLGVIYGSILPATASVLVQIRRGPMSIRSKRRAVTDHSCDAGDEISVSAHYACQFVCGK